MLDAHRAAVRGQFFAGGSYGSLQITLGEWLKSPDGRRSALTRVLDPSTEQAHHLNVEGQWPRGVQLGAITHE